MFVVRTLASISFIKRAQSNKAYKILFYTPDRVVKFVGPKNRQRGLHKNQMADKETKDFS